jgi:plastocyanin
MARANQLLIVKDEMNQRDSGSVRGTIIGSSEPNSQMGPEEAEVEIEIDYFTFMPDEITVALAATVTWVNLDDVQHTVASMDKTFKSKVLGTGDSFSFTFEKPGTYEYCCSIHPKMQARIIVR